jgi:hypothetical protein
LALRDELAQHFAEEEAGGCIEEAVCRCPRLASEARHVERQHPVLLDELDGVIALARVLQPGRVGRQTLLNEFDEFAANLKKHESAEDHILQVGFGTGIVCNDREL